MALGPDSPKPNPAVLAPTRRPRATRPTRPHTSHVIRAPAPTINPSRPPPPTSHHAGGQAVGKVRSGSTHRLRGSLELDAMEQHARCGRRLRCSASPSRKCAMVGRGQWLQQPSQASLSAGEGGRWRVLMASENLFPPTRPHPRSVERRSLGKWLQTAPQEPKCQEQRTDTVTDNR